MVGTGTLHIDDDLPLGSVLLHANGGKGLGLKSPKNYNLWKGLSPLLSSSSPREVNMVTNRNRNIVVSALLGFHTFHILDQKLCLGCGNDM